MVLGVSAARSDFAAVFILLTLLDTAKLFPLLDGSAIVLYPRGRDAAALIFLKLHIGRLSQARTYGYDDS
jgi:hypothetical protein